MLSSLTERGQQQQPGYAAVEGVGGTTARELLSRFESGQGPSETDDPASGCLIFCFR